MSLINKLYILSFFSGILALNAQTKLTGKVMDYKDEPQTDVMVYLDTIKADVNINKRGYFRLTVPDATSEINIFSPKYGLLSSEFKGEEKMNFIFLNPSESNNADDMVSLDYSDLTESNTTDNNPEVNLEESKDVVGYATIFDYIRGKVPGVIVSQNNRITIRGVKSVSGMSDPLFIVNGMPVNDLSFVDVNQVKDIKVLKNGASMYGTRGSNGVLIITLKK